MELAIEGSGIGLWDRNVETGEIHYSSSWKAILGYDASELSTDIQASYTRVHPDDLAYVQQTIQDHFDRVTEKYEVEHRLRCKDGSYKWVLSRGRVVQRDAAGKALRMVGTTTDITSTRVLAEKLQGSIDLLVNLTNEMPGLVFQYKKLPDGHGCFPYASSRIGEIYEVSPEQVAGSDMPALQRIHPEDLEHYRFTLASSAESLQAWHCEYRVLLPKQGLRWRQVDAHPARLQNGEILWHGLITDITARKHIEHELTALARLDHLTQLPNRRYFREQMEIGLHRTRHGASLQATVLMIDIDNFKSINDTHGHTIGDAAIRHFAGILKEELRKNDIAGRLGGDEFVVLLSETTLREARIFADRLQEKMLKTHFLVNGSPIHISISIGISVMSAADTNTDDPLSRADMALYSAKERGRNRVEVAAALY